MQPCDVMGAKQAAFDKLDSIYGTYTEKSAVKGGFQLPRHCMSNTDLHRIINSDEVREAQAKDCMIQHVFCRLDSGAKTQCLTTAPNTS